MKIKTVIAGLTMLLTILTCSRIPPEEPPPQGTLVGRTVLAEVFTKTG